jgi:ferritin-like metal-binding protein YciE
MFQLIEQNGKADQRRLADMVRKPYQHCSEPQLTSQAQHKSETPTKPVQAQSVLSRKQQDCRETIAIINQFVAKRAINLSEWL